MPRRKERPGTWAWRIGALKCKIRCQMPDSRTWMCGRAEHPRRCTYANCKYAGYASAIMAAGRAESEPTKSEGEIRAEEANRRMERDRRRNVAVETLLLLSQGMCPGSISDRLGIQYPEARKLWKEIAEEMGK